MVMDVGLPAMITLPVSVAVSLVSVDFEMITIVTFRFAHTHKTHEDNQSRTTSIYEYCDIVVWAMRLKAVRVQ